MYNDDMKFVATHEWVQLDNDSIVKIGITNHAQELLGDLVFIELPKLGRQIKSHEVIGVIESVKAASDLYSPVTGEVIAINEEVIADPALVNSAPHKAGWLLKIKLNDMNELNVLMSAAEYKNSISA